MRKRKYTQAEVKELVDLLSRLCFEFDSTPIADIVNVTYPLILKAKILLAKFEAESWPVKTGRFIKWDYHGIAEYIIRCYTHFAIRLEIYSMEVAPMPFEHINIHVPAPNPMELKAEIKDAADAKNMSLSEFMIWLYQEWKKKQARSRAK